MTDTDSANETPETDEPNASTPPTTEAGETNAAGPDDVSPDGGTADASAESANPSQSDDSSGSNLVTFVEWAAFAILCLLALVATFRFYFAASEAIRIWFSRDFVPIFQAAFNLVVLIAAAIGISVLVRRLR